MRLGFVRGKVVLSAAIPALRGTSLLLVEPVNAANLAARNGQGGGKTLVVADRLSPGTGQLIGIVEGREAANPFHPAPTPVDAYCAVIVHDYKFEPPARSPAAATAPESTRVAGIPGVVLSDEVVSDGKDPLSEPMTQDPERLHATEQRR